MEELELMKTGQEVSKKYSNVDTANADGDEDDDDNDDDESINSNTMVVVSPPRSSNILIFRQASMPRRDARRRNIWTGVIVSFLCISIAFISYWRQEDRVDGISILSWQLNSNKTGTAAIFDAPGLVPAPLFGTVYKTKDFVNRIGRAPPYWECRGNSCNTSVVWGPCYAPRNRIDWAHEVDQVKNSKDGEPIYHKASIYIPAPNDLRGFCRPGFLIIGAGKCGTSSLYHYLTDHPRVVPANEKQIHYFKYFPERSLKWYYSHFPTSTNFLASGALITGEASPGYLPYPEVSHLVAQRMPGPRIIAIGRDPLDRAWSSYRYNYANPVIDNLRKGRYHNIPRDKPISFYKEFLFSFEDMIIAELAALRKCFAPDGPGIVGARDKYGGTSWGKYAIEQREKLGLPPMVDLDGFCYGQPVNSSISRPQWTELFGKYPDKIIDNTNVHLKQSFVGRGLYVFPLEWWYSAFPTRDIFFMCTEELSDFSGQPMDELALFLGLPEYNFSSIVQAGAYNVGGHKGYDNEITWEDVKADIDIRSNIPLSDEVLTEFLEFVQPYNERLFALTGRRCNWRTP